MRMARACLALAGGLLWLLAGCAGHKAVKSGPPPGTAPTGEEIMTWQESRRRSLVTAELRGSAEFRWSDSNGNHFENGDFDLSWREADGQLQTAARLSKVGKRALWIGSSGKNWWFFDLASEVHTLHLGVVGAPGAGTPCGFVDPIDLLRLLGISRPGGAAIQSVEWDGEAGAWRVQQGDCRFWMSPGALEVSRVELRDAAGVLRASCQLEEYGFVEAANMAHGAQPRMAMRARCTIAQSAECPPAEILLSFDRLRVPPQALADRLFSIDALIDSLKPAVIEGNGAARAPVN